MNISSLPAPHFLMAAGGALLITVSLLWLVFSEYRKYGFSIVRPASFGAGSSINFRWLLLPGIVVLVGFLLRLYEIDLKTITHPEAYTPNIDLPPGISEPPPRHRFLETLKWHFYDEPHPVGYYMGMWLWTKLVGTSLFAMRLASTLFGVLSIVLVYSIAKSVYNRQVALVSAVLLATSGFHIYWSQIARMYAPGCFFGLLSIWLLFKLYHREKPDANLEIAYILTLLAGVSTQIFFWPFLGMQMLWILFNYSKTKGNTARILYLQTLGIIIGSPMWSHIVLMMRQHHADTPTLDFLINYFSFGFVLKTTDRYEMIPGFPLIVTIAVLALAIILILKGLQKTPGLKAQPATPTITGPFIPLISLSIGMSLLMFSLSFTTPYKVDGLRVISLLPLIALLIPYFCAKAGPGISTWLHANNQSWLSRTLLPSPVTMLAIIPTLILFLVSFWVSVIAPRAFLIFVPYLLILISAGIVAFSSKRAITPFLTAGMAAIMIASIIHYHKNPSSPREYQELARLVNEKLKPDDMIFVKRDDWCTTPLFYYLKHRNLFAHDFEDRIRQHPAARIWVIDFDCHDFAKHMEQKLNQTGYTRADEVITLRAKSQLYMPGRGNH